MAPDRTARNPIRKARKAAFMRSSSPRGRRGEASLPSLTILAAALALVAVLGACAVGGATTAGGATATATPTTDDSALTPTVLAGTTPTATTGGGAATATPLPVLQSQVVTQALSNSIAANTNSPIVDVTCPAGFLVAGGGIASGYTKFTTMYSAPISTTKWRAEVFNNSASTIAAQVQVMCVKASGLVGQVVTQALSNSIAANTNSPIVDVACPAGYLVAGGGIASGYGNFTTMFNAPISTTKFRAEIFNRSAGTIAAQVQVMCLRATGLQEQVLAQTLGNSIGANTNSAIVDITCPAGFLVAGGGINSGYTNFTTMYSAPISTTKWRAEVFNNSASTMAAQAQVSCLKLG